ncbi:MAG: YggS family pyridoxal phosphate-dependent enzyme [candidate division KSB1 bacterium]|nr:YggS family pyridoxal phosphate-dependent enzyme [candidate division KSB1 bacterium]
MSIAKRVRAVRNALPQHVLLEAAAKTRRADEVLEAVNAGITILGYNYVQEAEKIQESIHVNVKWHLIGHLQSNKVKQAVRLFDMIETIDSEKIAKRVDKKCRDIEKIMPVLVQVNSGREPQKNGVMPDDIIPLIRKISNLPNLRVEGLMTMGPLLDNPKKLAPYFRLTKQLFDQIAKENIVNTEMRRLSMGMSNSYQIAVQEGANLVRIGTALFGPRQ